jgi:flavin-dependent dehydrogenase
MSKKIIIVGAGPVGCYTAQLLKLYGFDPLLIEEHIEVGRPVHCTGLVGRKIFSEKRAFGLPVQAITNVINGAVIHYQGQSFTILRKKVAYVLDRERFDKGLSKGLNILYERRFLGIEKINSRYVIETNKEELSADTVIGSDGVNSALRRILNPGNDMHFFKSFQLRIETKPRYNDLVEVFLKNPSFFWVVPEGNNIIRVGTISQNPYRDLQYFLKEAGIGGKVIERFGGVVALGICEQTVKDNVALVGDAACQLKPLSYGGIYFGIKAATILADCIRKNRLSEYDRLWKKELAFEIKIGLKVKDIYSRISSEELKKIFKILKSQKSLIERIGDFENHGKLVLEIIKRPAFYSQAGQIFQIFFKNLL